MNPPNISTQDMIRDVSTLGLAPSLTQKLIQEGFRTLADFVDVSPVELAKELSISNEEALKIIKTITSKGQTNQSQDGATALDLLKKEDERKPIITFNPHIDEMLGGGIPIGRITEFCGVPGIGKTQLGIQLAVDVSIPDYFDGADGECIYIDTEGSFVIERVIEVAEALVKHLHSIAEHSGSVEDKEAADKVTVDNILSRIHFYRVHDYIEQIALVNILPSILQQHPKIKLIVIDSVTFHFRHDFEDMRLRTRLLSSLAQNLTNFSEKYALAVVVINQMTTKVADSSFGSGTGGGDAMLIPALGDTWGHCCTNRIILLWKDGCRYAHLLKSPSKKSQTVPYHVTADGIR